MELQSGNIHSVLLVIRKAIKKCPFIRSNLLCAVNVDSGFGKTSHNNNLFVVAIIGG